MKINKMYTTSLLLLFAINSFAQIPAGYYNTAAGLEGSALKTELFNIIKGHTEYPYTSSSTDTWDILIESDEDPNNSNNFILIYTGRSIPKSSIYPAWNREHVWAKSHGDFDTDPPAGTDAHHLRPSDVSVNADRGNLDFDDGGTQNAEATECYSDDDSWEPRDAVKGDIARMMFYMATRYDGDSGDNGGLDLELLDYTGTSGSFFGKLSTLMQWHAQDPVDDIDKHRNEIVYSYQHNRNPFIDHPEWVECIWGNNCIIAVDHIYSKTMNIFPNPAKNTISITSNIIITKVNIYDILGKVVSHIDKYNSKEINTDISTFTKGIYFIEITDINNDRILKKLIKD